MQEIAESVINLRAQRKFEEAYRLLKVEIERTEEKEALSEAYHLMGIVLSDMGRHSEALSSLQEALTLKPENSLYLTNMAVVLRRMGRDSEAKACLEHALEIDPENASALNNLGNIVRDEGRINEAKALYERALSLNEQMPEIKINLALVYADMGELKRAREMLVEIVRQYPELQPARKALGSVLTKMGDFASAEANYRYALLLNPKDSATYCELGALLSIMDPPVTKEAEDMLLRSIELNPDNADAYHNLGVLYGIMGKKERAKECYRKALSLKPKSAVLMRHLAQMIDFREEPEYLERIQELEKEELSLLDRIELNLSLYEAYKKLKEYEKAFQYLLQANTLKRKTLEYSREEIEKTVAVRITVFNEENLKKLRGYGFPCEIPVFVVGLPRSGTTLMESLLDSHPEIFGAGELKLFQDVMKAGIMIEGKVFIAENEKMPQSVFKAPEGFFHIGFRYVTELRRLAPWAKRIVDKMPGNFFQIALIVLSMPQAKVIHMRRHPLDNLLSCFEQPFTERHEWTYSLEELAHYYNEYLKLAKHWERVFPEVLQVDYEALVLNFDEEIMRVLDYVGVKWHEDIRRFYEKDRVVRTASMEQVRNPLYTSSIGRWKRYEKFLTPLISNLSDDAKQEIKRFEEIVSKLMK